MTALSPLNARDDAEIARIVAADPRVTALHKALQKAGLAKAQISAVRLLSELLAEEWDLERTIRGSRLDNAADWLVSAAEDAAAGDHEDAAACRIEAADAAARAERERQLRPHMIAGIAAASFSYSSTERSA